jgi:membrane-bound lytic murein transglycosylase D
MVLSRSFVAIAAAVVLLPSIPLGHAQTSSAASQSTPAQHQRVQQLIQNVEKAYENGVASYRDGHLSAAKSNFDYAVDQMLTSGIPIKSDADLNAEFDRIVDAVNTLEMDSLKQGNGFAAAAEPTPAEAAEQATFSVDPAVVAQAQEALKTTQSDLPLVLNDYVASFITFYTKSRVGHGTIVASLQRAGRYREMIEKVLKEEGLPQDLIYLAFAESGFRPQALNAGSGAGGMWQFMPFGVYGLSRTGWYDERFDPEKATRAYARLIKANYAQLGDWYLAIAAYNWGAGAVQRAVQRTGYADFWELYRRNNLPAQTKNYVPEIIAVALIAKNPKQYGLENIESDPPLLMDTVKTDYSVDLRLVADITGASVQEIVGLNPSLLRMATPPDESYELHLPAGTLDLFQKEIAEIPEDKRRYWRFHKLASGETLEEVARAYHVSASEIATANQLSSTDDVSNLEALVIPVAPATAPALRTALYHARRGDTLVTVADRFGVTVDQLKRWNRLKTTAVPVGRGLYVAEPANISSSVSRSSRGRASAGAARRTTTRTSGKASRHTAKSTGSGKARASHAQRRARKS